MLLTDDMTHNIPSLPLPVTHRTLCTRSLPGLYLAFKLWTLSKTQFLIIGLENYATECTLFG